MFSVFYTRLLLPQGRGKIGKSYGKGNKSFCPEAPQRKADKPDHGKGYSRGLRYQPQFVLLPLPRSSVTDRRNGNGAGGRTHKGISVN